MLIIISIKKKKVWQWLCSKNSVQKAEFPFLFISIIHSFNLERMALSFKAEVCSLFLGKMCQHDRSWRETPSRRTCVVLLLYKYKFSNIETYIALNWCEIDPVLEWERKEKNGLRNTSPVNSAVLIGKQ